MKIDRPSFVVAHIRAGDLPRLVYPDGLLNYRIVGGAYDLVMSGNLPDLEAYLTEALALVVAERKRIHDAIDEAIADADADEAAAVTA